MLHLRLECDIEMIFPLQAIFLAIEQKCKRLFVQRRKLLAQMFQFWHVVEDDIGLEGMQRQIVLVMLLSRIELLQRHNLRNDGRGKYAGAQDRQAISSRQRQLAALEARSTDVILRDLVLLLAAIEDRRAVLASGVRTLPVQLGGIMRHIEKHLQQLLIGNLLGVEMDTHRFGMAGRSFAHHFVMRG